MFLQFPKPYLSFEPITAGGAYIELEDLLGKHDMDRLANNLLAATYDAYYCGQAKALKDLKYRVIDRISELRGKIISAEKSSGIMASKFYRGEMIAFEAAIGIVTGASNPVINPVINTIIYDEEYASIPKEQTLCFVGTAKEEAIKFANTTSKKQADMVEEVAE